MRLIAMGILVTLLSAAGCSENPGVQEEPPLEATEQRSGCYLAADMRIPGNVDWVNVEPDFLIEWDNARNETIDVTYQDAKICDLIAIDFIFEGRKAPNWFSKNPRLHYNEDKQLERVSSVSKTYVKRQSDAEGFVAETRVRKFYVLNSAKPAAIKAYVSDIRCFGQEKATTVASIIRIQPPADP